MEDRIIKYPRTPHVEGSRLAPGDEDLSQIPFGKIKDRYLVLEEKVDGANTAVSFGSDGQLLLQSRGHFLMGGGRERQYNFFKIWGSAYQSELYEILGERYIMYGEWMYAKHAIYYDALPHYFLEFDIYDKENKVFLDTEKRKKMLEGSSIYSAPTLAQGYFKSKAEILKYLGDSAYITKDHLDNLRAEAISLGLDPEREVASTPAGIGMEGIYIKVEENGIVTDRMKFVRPDFRQIQLKEDDNTGYRPILKNKLADINGWMY